MLGHTYVHPEAYLASDSFVEGVAVEDIQVDGSGDLRCSNCGGKSFTRKRTRRAKILGATAGVATVGVAGLAAPLVATQKLYCQSCGTYNRMGAAKPYKPKSPSPAKPATSSLVSSSTRTPGRPPRKSSKSEDILFTLFLAGLFLALFIWAFTAGSILWSIVTGLLLAFCVFLVFTAVTLERSDVSPPRPGARDADAA